MRSTEGYQQVLAVAVRLKNLKIAERNAVSSTLHVYMLVEKLLNLNLLKH